MVNKNITNAHPQTKTSMNPYLHTLYQQHLVPSIPNVGKNTNQ